MSFECFTDDQLVQMYKDKADDMSFFSAAEGQSWYQETAARNKCQEEFRNIKQALIDRDIELPSGNWLI